ncbi:unnamed protein product [Adineta steineri]|uniref:CABIT domain-containing protein n=1 Tax=Adineta steineri TaxID=433720 RepID=A0A815EUV9_9BILA|nr:unnamed protein product [Adineta steineri]CAF1316369.1 unnamed protein product [Adineta steineri]CAF1582398.1 unnamed protein product [Adineta steineri]CAF1582493.1 unnamed protein product [Adineta steineri]
MLKWAVTPRANGDCFEQDGIHNGDNRELLTLQAIIEQHRLPCLVRLINDDINETLDNYCLLLCQTNDPYLLVSNESERFSIPLSFDGLFAPVEQGVTRYNILQSIRALQSHLKLQPSSASSSSGFSQFTTLQPCMAYSNSALRRIRSGTILEPCRAPIITCRSPSPSNSTSSSTTTTSTKRIRALLANIPHSLNKHILPHHPHSRIFKNQMPPSDYLEVKSLQYDEHFCLKSDSMGVFVPVYTQLPANNTSRRSSLLPCSSPFSSSFSNQVQGLYTVELLSKLIHQYPLITELIVSRTLEENVPTSVGYPFRRLTLHRLVEQHTRIIAFDMKNYAFLELDTTNSIDLYAVEHDDTLFQRYQAQLRWCDSHMSPFRSQIKTVVHSSNGTAMFVQATPLHGQQLQQYHQHRNSTSKTTSPIPKHIPQTIFTSQESISSLRSRARTPSASKFNTTSNHLKQDQLQLKSKTTRSNGTTRKDVRVYFNDPIIQKQLEVTSRPMIKQTSFNKKHSSYRTNSTESDSIDGDGEIEDSYQCTAL